MKFKFSSKQDCQAASSELSRYFSGNGYEYEDHSYDHYIIILPKCHNIGKAQEICRQYGGH